MPISDQRESGTIRVGLHAPKNAIRLNLPRVRAQNKLPGYGHAPRAGVQRLLRRGEIASLVNDTRSRSGRGPEGENSHVPPRVHGPVVQLLAHAHQEHLDLLRGSIPARA